MAHLHITTIPQTYWSSCIQHKTNNPATVASAVHYYHYSNIHSPFAAKEDERPQFCFVYIPQSFVL